MPEATVTGKGQITVPAEVRRELGLRPGSRVEFVRDDAGRYEFVPKTRSLRSLRGSIPAPVTPVTVEEMNGAIAEEAARASTR